MVYVPTAQMICALLLAALLLLLAAPGVASCQGKDAQLSRAAAGGEAESRGERSLWNDTCMEGMLLSSIEDELDPKGGVVFFGGRALAVSLPGAIALALLARASAILLSGGARAAEANAASGDRCRARATAGSLEPTAAATTSNSADALAAFHFSACGLPVLLEQGVEEKGEAEAEAEADFGNNLFAADGCSQSTTVREEEDSEEEEEDDDEAFFFGKPGRFINEDEELAIPTDFSSSVAAGLCQEYAASVDRIYAAQLLL
jgi:hypothetical protein